MHGMDVNEEIDYWRERAKRAEEQLADKHSKLQVDANIALIYSDRLREHLAAMTKARDEACDIAETLAPLRIKDAPTTRGAIYRDRIAELRKVGAP